MIESESERSGDIVKNMVLFSRKETLRIKPYDLNQVVDSSIDLIAHHLQLNNIKLERDYQTDLPKVKLDENQIKQALLALYMNAVEAMEGEGCLTLTTEYDPIEEHIIILISDTGHGITEEDQRKIFDPFFTTKEVGEGTGLGLALSYGIIREHDGSIALESEVDQGTTFIVRLPAAIDQKVPAVNG